MTDFTEYPIDHVPEGQYHTLVCSILNTYSLTTHTFSHLIPRILLSQRKHLLALTLIPTLSSSSHTPLPPPPLNPPSPCSHPQTRCHHLGWKQKQRHRLPTFPSKNHHLQTPLTCRRNRINQ